MTGPTPSTPYREIRIPLTDGTWVTTFRCDTEEQFQEALEVARLEREIASMRASIRRMDELERKESGAQACPPKRTYDDRLRRDVYRRAGFRGRLRGSADGPERFYWAERWRDVGARS